MPSEKVESTPDRSDLCSQSSNAHLVNVTPVLDGGANGLVLEFENSVYKFASVENLITSDEYEFLRHRNRFLGYKYDECGIIWYNGKSIEANALFRLSREISRDLLALEVSCISRRWDESIMILPFFTDKFLILQRDPPEGYVSSSYLAGNVDVRSAYYSLEELLQLSDWKSYFEKSGCAWGIEVIESCRNNKERVIKLLIEGKLERNDPTSIHQVL